MRSAVGQTLTVAVAIVAVGAMTGGVSRFDPTDSAKVRMMSAVTSGSRMAANVDHPAALQITPVRETWREGAVHRPDLYIATPGYRQQPDTPESQNSPVVYR
jgi:hypothetical protein